MYLNADSNPRVGTWRASGKGIKPPGSRSGNFGFDPLRAIRAIGAARSARLLVKQEVAGSNPAWPASRIWQNGLCASLLRKPIILRRRITLYA